MSAPDSSKWNYDTGGGGWGNNEEETYCAPGSNVAPCSAANPNAYLDGSGNLVIQAINSGGTWTSARMQTSGKEELQYGRVEARMKLPRGAGVWPAFWLLGANFSTAAWPLCGEMDVMENVPQLGPNKIASTIHGPLSGGNGVGSRFTFPAGSQVDTGFHTYGVIWSPNQAQFYVDDPTQPFFTLTKSTGIPGDWVFNHSFFVILNLAIGGYYPGYSDRTTPNPSVMTVDYVRVYRHSDSLVSGAISVHAGGDTVGGFFADTNYSGGTPVSSSAAIDTSLIPAPVPPSALYQTARQGALKYTVTELIPNAKYVVHLHFAETQSTGVGERQFNVAINSKSVLSNFDIYAAAGGANKAVEESFNTVADPLSGGIVISLTNGRSGEPLISGISVQAVGIPAPSGRVSIHAGGGDVGSFVADTDYSGGNTSNTFTSVDTSLIQAPVPPIAVFQTDRWGPSTYTLGGFVPGTTHTVTLYFAEIYWTAPGQREFNVALNGTGVLTNFDIVADAGGANKAIEKVFPAQADQNGNITVKFSVGAVDQPKISGISVN